MLGASFPVWSLNWWKQYEKDSKRPLFEHFLGLLAITYISCLQIQDSIGKAFDLRFLQNKGSSFSVFFSFLEFSVIYWIRYNFPILCYLLFHAFSLLFHYNIPALGFIILFDKENLVFTSVITSQLQNENYTSKY